MLTEADTVLASLRLEADQWRGSWGGQAAVPTPPAPPAASSAPTGPLPPYPTGGGPPPPYPTGGGPPPPYPTGGGPLPSYPRAGPQGPTPPGRHWTAGSLLLALGALCLVVAAFVFVSVSWGSLGLFGRTLVLLGVTAVGATVAVVTTRRRLPASSEALWAVTAGLLTLDFFAARDYGMLGLGSLGPGGTFLAYGLLALVVGVAVAVWSRGRLSRALWAPQILAAIGVWSALAGTADLLPWPAFWVGLTVLLLALALTAAFTAVRLVPFAALSAGIVAYLLAAGVAVADSFDDARPSLLIKGGSAAEVLVLAAVTIGLGVLVSRRMRARPTGSQSAALVEGASAAIATLLVTALAYAPLTTLGATGRTIGVGVIALVLVAAALPFAGAWGRGARLAALVTVTWPLFAYVTWCAIAAATLLESTEPVWRAEADVRLRTVDGPGPAWLGPVAAVALAGCIALAASWRRSGLPPSWRRIALAGAGLVAGTGVLLPMALFPLPVLVPTGVVLLVAAAAAGYGIARQDLRAQVTALVCVAVASALPLASEVASLIAWGAGGVVLVAVAASRQWPIQVVAAAAATAWATAVAATAADLLGASERTLSLVVVLAGALVLAAAQLLRGRRRLAVESTAAVVLVLGLAASVNYPLAWQSAMWTIVGVVTVVVALLTRDRRMLAPVGTALLGVAYVLRLAASDVGVVEAYTLPFSVVLLAAGAVAMWRNRSVRTRLALLPGLTLGLLPSLPSVLDDPTTLRGLLLGLAAAAVLAAGVVLRWQAPFLMGGFVVAVIVVRQLGPYSDAVPRWSLIAAAGLALLVTGITWESRVRQAKAAASFVRSMR